MKKEEKEQITAITLLTKKDTVEIIDSPLVKIWLKEKAKRDSVAFCRLVGDNSVRFKRILGKSETRELSFGKEFVWLWEEQGVVFLITSSIKGTRFFINYTGGQRAFIADRRMGSAATGFLERLILALSGNSLSVK